MITALLAAAMLSAGLLSPPALADTTVPGDQAAEAIAKALEQASRTGMTYREQGELKQRNAAGDVAIALDRRKIDTIVLREGERAVVLSPYRPDASNKQISAQLRKAFGHAKEAYVVLPEPEEADTGSLDGFLAWFDPFTPYADVPTAEVVVDSAGRAIEVRFGRERVVQVLSWDAPLAVRPEPRQILDADTWSTILFAEASADFMHSYMEELGDIAQSYPYYTSDPVGTLRRAARDTGWPASNSSRGITITMTDGVGTTWRAVLVADSGGSRIAKFTVLARPDVVSIDVASAKALMGIFAMSILDQVTCPLRCRLEGGASPLTAANAEKALLKPLKDLGIPRQTPGPDYPELDDGMLGSFGLSTTGQSVSGGLSFSLAGYCVRVPIDGPGVWRWPTSFAAVPGEVGPFGTCQQGTLRTSPGNAP